MPYSLLFNLPLGNATFINTHDIPNCLPLRTRHTFAHMVSSNNQPCTDFDHNILTPSKIHPFLLCCPLPGTDTSKLSNLSSTTHAISNGYLHFCDLLQDMVYTVQPKSHGLSHVVFMQSSVVCDPHMKCEYNLPMMTSNQLVHQYPNHSLLDC